MHQAGFAPQIPSLGPGKHSLLFPLSLGLASGCSLPLAPFLGLSGLCCSPDLTLGAAFAGEPWLLGGPYCPHSGTGRCFLLHSPGYRHGTLQRRLAFQLHVNRSWKEKVSVVFPLCLPGGYNLDFLECKVVLGHSSACRQRETMGVRIRASPGCQGAVGAGKEQREAPTLEVQLSSHPTHSVTSSLSGVQGGGFCSTTPFSRACAGERGAAES